MVDGGALGSRTDLGMGKGRKYLISMPYWCVGAAFQEVRDGVHGSGIAR